MDTSYLTADGRYVPSMRRSFNLLITTCAKKCTVTPQGLMLELRYATGLCRLEFNGHCWAVVQD
jgi:hypothetical protein